MGIYLDNMAYNVIGSYVIGSYLRVRVAVLDTVMTVLLVEAQGCPSGSVHGRMHCRFPPEIPFTLLTASSTEPNRTFSVFPSPHSARRHSGASSRTVPNSITPPPCGSNAGDRRAAHTVDRSPALVAVTHLQPITSGAVMQDSA